MDNLQDSIAKRKKNIESQQKEIDSRLSQLLQPLMSERAYTTGPKPQLTSQLLLLQQQQSQDKQELQDIIQSDYLCQLTHILSGLHDVTTQMQSTQKEMSTTQKGIQSTQETMSITQTAMKDTQNALHTHSKLIIWLTGVMILFAVVIGVVQICFAIRLERLVDKMTPTSQPQAAIITNVK